MRPAVFFFRHYLDVGPRLKPSQDTSMRPLRFLLPLLALVLAAAPLGAQPLRGRLVGDDGRPLARVPVVLVSTAGRLICSTAPGARCFFRLQAPGNCRYEIQAGGTDGMLRSIAVTVPADIGTDVRLSLHLRAEP